MGHRIGKKSVIVTDMDHCYACGSPYTEVHHVLHGNARKAADKYGYVVGLCRMCHMSIHDGGGQDLDLHLKQLAQWHFEEHHGTRDEFIQTFGRSYL